jgi:Ca2+-binding EF-hand superfamily protein
MANAGPLQLDVARKRGAPSGSGEGAPPTGSSPAKKPKHFDNSELGLDQLRAIFAECDADGDGVVTKIEFIKACRRNKNISAFFELPPNIRQEDGSRTQMEKLFQDMDKDGDRVIRWAELLAYFNKVLGR